MNTKRILFALLVVVLATASSGCVTFENSARGRYVRIGIKYGAGKAWSWFKKKSPDEDLTPE
jgi:hypothetical protein